MGHVMQDRESSTFESNWLVNVAGIRRSQQPASVWNIFEPDDHVLVVRDPFRDRARTSVLVTAAVVASFGLGLAGGLNWPQFAGLVGVETVALNEAPAPRLAEARPAAKIDAPRRTAAAADGPVTVGSISKPSTLLPGGPRASASHALPASAGPSAATIMARPQPLVAAPETRPTTISGWSVVDVRDGTAVLEGPDGIRMAARGDTIPGVGRVESIVRWGGRWVVATAGGLIATP
jgi:hypothetical protein